MAARGAIRDVGRAQGVPLDEVDRIAKLIPPGPKQTIRAALTEVAELKTLYESQPYVRRLVDGASQVEGISRHFSTHACGVLITDKPLVAYTPLQRAPRGEGIVSQLCMSDVEEIGLLKLDVLGLSTLTIIDRAFQWIVRTRGSERRSTPSPWTIPRPTRCSPRARSPACSRSRLGHAPRAARHAAQRVSRHHGHPGALPPGRWSSFRTMSTASSGAKS